VAPFGPPSRAGDRAAILPRMRMSFGIEDEADGSNLDEPTWLD
jgi:hypothetical protein